ncbi:hypothetical protein ABEB36_005175 [Hypothenemus hampei]|uniref:Transposase n=1 Tax=Hypothenemus hampei TaxID=57062 RepID=A0ABD1EXE6_HYPHA
MEGPTLPLKHVDNKVILFSGNANHKLQAMSTSSNQGSFQPGGVCKVCGNHDHQRTSIYSGLCTTEVIGEFDYFLGVNTGLVNFDGFCFRHQSTGQKIYGIKCFRPKFDSYVVRTTIDRLVNQLFFLPEREGWNKGTLVCFGDGSLKSGQSCRRNLLPVIVDLQKIFHRCCDKFRVMEDGKQKRRHSHRFLVCRNCRTVWNRDVNAARNMILVATGEVNYREGQLGQTPPQFVKAAGLYGLNF